jgi:HD domain
MQIAHLLKRALSSFSNAEPREITTALDVLSPAEFELWQTMQGRDKTHSLAVLQRFDEICPAALRAERAAALLHDVGKTFANLGWLARIVATITGPRGFRFHLYHDHENLGAQMLSGISDDRTITLVAGTATDHVMVALRSADQI